MTNSEHFIELHVHNEPVYITAKFIKGVYKLSSGAKIYFIGGGEWCVDESYDEIKNKLDGINKQGEHDE